MRVVELAGKTLGTWEVLSRDDDGSGRARWKCRCNKCGHIKAMYGTSIRANASNAGCQKCHRKNEASQYPSEYASWLEMKTRVLNKNRPEYAKYSLRGIDTKWQHSFAAFVAHIGPKPAPEYTVERINNDLGYFPGNVRWATRKEQASNTSRNLKVTIAEKQMTLMEAAELLPIPYNTLRDWVHQDRFTAKVAQFFEFT